LKQRIGEILALLKHSNDLSTEEGRRREREKRILYSALTAALAKVINTAIPLLTIKITLAYLGYELYGLWAAITSFFALFVFADLGLGNGLQTELSRATGKNDIETSRKLVSSCYAVLSIVTIGLIGLLLVLYPFINWAKIMNAESSLAISMTGGFVLAIFLSKLIMIPISLVQRTQIAIQEGYITNIWSCAGSILSLAIVYLFSMMDLGRLEMMWASSFVTVVVTALNAVVFFGIKRRDLCPSIKFVDKTVAKGLLNTGLLFFFLSILTSVSLSLDNYIVTLTVGLNETASYSIAYKIASFIGIISVMLSTPLWAANGEALVRGDVSWVKSQTRKMTLLSLALAVMATIALLLFANPILNWMGKDLSVSAALLLGMCLTQILIATTNPAFMVLNASRKIKCQMVMYGLYAIVSLSLKYVLGLEYGAVWVSWVGAIAYLLIICPAVTFYYTKVIRENR